MSGWSEGGDSAESPPFFLTDPDAGYGRYLGPLDDGTWRRYFRTGASGHGLLLTTVQNNYCCAGPLPRDGVSSDDIPWLLPVLVKWESVLSSDREVPLSETDLASFEHDYISFPPVIITDWYGWDHENHVEFTSWLNLATGYNLGDSSIMEGEGYYVEGLGGSIIGVAYPWQLVPLTEPAHDEIFEWFQHKTRQWNTWSLAFANCWDDEEMDDEDLIGRDDPSYVSEYAPIVGRNSAHGTEVCSDAVGRGETRCACGRPAFQWQLALGLISGTLDGFDLLPPKYDDLWWYAVTRHATGWAHVAQQVELGDQCSSLSWQRYSPYSRTSSPSRHLRELSRDWRLSPEASASSTGSGPSSMAS